MRSLFTILAVVLIVNINFSQNNKSQVPYYELPGYPEKFTAGSMAARMVDALGFRFYWASNNLNEEDLMYKANKDGRTTLETLNHIYDLSKIIVNSTMNKSNDRTKQELSYEDLRINTLMNLKSAADILRVSNDISQFKIIFGTNEIPFWNQVNGPIADSIWHCGQLAIYRRNTGNPINPKVNHFSGTVND